jgi:2-polyprenyl-6-methoxyphenol hydroxylase-like FAD-dependent oxidoreductase
MSTASPTNKHVLIVGGGTAGWMAANLMAACWISQGMRITLLESPEIGTVGVGEGSTPQLKSFFDFLNIEESEWMPACHATYKNGISFQGWSSKPGYERYFHPFESDLDAHTEPAFFYNCDVRRKGVDVYAHPDRFYLSAYLAQHHLGPKASENFPFRIGYGYHFDATLLGKFLRTKATELGVNHVEARVLNVEQSEKGEIRAVTTDDGLTVAADLFVDCSGFSGLLIQKALKVPFENFGENLFNDAAVAIPSEQTADVGSQTISTALRNGWAWEIPLTHRKGNGYVYSSAFCSKDEAETELRAKLGLLDSDVEARHLNMCVGRVQKHWEKNCLAVGLSQGFIEPLEATALHIVQETLQGFIDAWELGGFTNLNEDKFNQRINVRFEGVRDYIVAHYVCNSRSDTEYWLANRQHGKVSDNLKAVLQGWVNGGDVAQLVRSRDMDRYYQPMSWYALLCGYGMFLDQERLVAGSAKAHKHNLADIDQFLQRCAMNFKPHHEVLSQLAAQF